jgi:phosphoribosylformylglycinamidine synthase
MMDVSAFMPLSRWHIQVFPKRAELDGRGRSILADVHQLGLTHVVAVRSSRLYFLEGELSPEVVQRIAERLLVDPVAETYRMSAGWTARAWRDPAVEVHVLPGVMNPPAISACDAIRRLLRSGASEGDSAKSFPSLHAVGTARAYEISGAAGLDDLERIASRLLANPCIERWYLFGFGRADSLPAEFPSPSARPFALRHVRLKPLDDDALLKLSRERHLFLSLDEMRALRDDFARQGRDPTDLELETFAQTWSEHCVHKTLKSAVEYEGEDFGKPGRIRARFDNLLKDTIMAATHRLAKDWCLSVFSDNAGVMAFDEEYGVAVKVETHNHPSAIEPYGGASTGVGGCLRDIMGCGLGAKPIASTDVFCLAPPDRDPARIPKDVLHPRRVLKGVVSGVCDYGNRMGVPTVNGAIFFEERYLANPLVFCGCVGLIPRRFLSKGPRPGDRIVLAGGRTGRDGLHGATFSSAELTDDRAGEFAHAVQIGNAIEQKKLLDAMLVARDHPGGCLYTAVTDCGAGGLSSAVGEMGAALGAEVHLDRVLLKYAGLRYDEIWISEAQERMVFAVPPERLETMLAVFAAEEVETADIGSFTDDKTLRVFDRGTKVGEIAMEFLHHGLPKSERKARWRPPPTCPTSPSPTAATPASPTDRLLRTLRDPTVASKEWVIRQYDHEVQSRSVIKPLVGPGAGPSDAAVLRPRLEGYRGIALGCGLCPPRGDEDPYWMAVRAVDEALRNVICVGADPERTAILDNFCWPTCDTPESLGALVRACRGAADAALAFGLPFLSGKDSLNNEFVMSEEEARRTGLPRRLAIPGTLLISAVGIVADVRRCVSMDLKEPGDVLVAASSPADREGLRAAAERHRTVAEWIGAGRARAAHDVSDGGLATAVAEMCIAGELGATVDLRKAPIGLDAWSMPPTTYLLEMSPTAANDVPFPRIGHVTAAPRLTITTEEGVIDVEVSRLADAWRAASPPSSLGTYPDGL